MVINAVICYLKNVLSIIEKGLLERILYGL